MSETKNVTMPVNGRYEPVSSLDKAYEGPDGTPMTAEFKAHKSSYVVVSALGTLFHGVWPTDENAKKFAKSMGPTAEIHPTVVKVYPYWYVPSYGKVG